MVQYVHVKQNQCENVQKKQKDDDDNKQSENQQSFRKVDDLH